jgi:hypothetical protein
MSVSKTIEDTEEHIHTVMNLIRVFCLKLHTRAALHDSSKLKSPELDYFSAIDAKTLDIKYGTPEYEEALKFLEPALQNHYAKNRHHPQHHPNGIKDMNLLDICEMFFDWLASTQRYKEGNILKSIAVNGERFKMSDDLIAIFNNTAYLFDNIEKEKD